MENGLTLYRSSAGSGKTFSLVFHYLLLSLSDEVNWKQTLAVTFTHKATHEMKSRVLKALHQLAEGEESAYLSLLCDKLSVNEPEIRRRANNLMNNLLHDYSYFSITTIDSFFYKIIRSFAREIDLFGNHSIEIDQNLVLKSIIENLIDKLNKDQDILKWMIAHATERIQEGRGWDIRNELENLSNELFDEAYFRADNVEGNELNYEQIRAKLDDKISIFRKSIDDRCNKLIRKLADFGLHAEDFPHKEKGFMQSAISLKGDYSKEIGKRLQEAVDDRDKWVGTTTKRKEDIAAARDNGLYELLNDLVSYYQENNEAYATAIEMRKHLYSYGLFGALKQEIAHYRSENEVLLISDFNVFLHKIINNEETPFILEKIGTRYNHYLLDEFQDTSTMQWQNFFPLIRESVDSGYASLIVGDPKQAIYRWRGGDAELMVDKVPRSFLGQVNEKILSANWRSDGRVVEFNNFFFRTLVNKMEDEILNATYADVTQQSKKDLNAGYVDISLYPKDTEKSLEDIVLGDLERLFDRGFSPSDICFLVRNNNEAAALARIILDKRNRMENAESEKYRVVSNVALMLAQAVSVRLIVNVIRYMADPRDKFSMANIIYDYQTSVRGKKLTTFVKALYGRSSEDSLGPFLPSGFFTHVREWKQLPLYDLAERIADAFNISSLTGEHNYLAAFMDEVWKFMVRQGSDLYNFLQWWETIGKSKAIDIPEDEEAIRVMTIHKAKGLEFPAVIIPEVSWSTDHSSNKEWMWVEIQKFLPDEKGLFPLMYTSGMDKTVYAEEYRSEKNKAYLDNLNLLYVAFTRAANALIVHGREDKNNIATEVRTVVEKADFGDFVIDSPHFRWCYGELTPPARASKSSLSLLKHTEFPYFRWNNKITIRRNIMKLSDDSSAAALFGTRFHQYMAIVRTLDDIPKVKVKLDTDGSLTHDEKNQLIAFFDFITKDSEVRQWFSTEWDVYTEQALLLPDGNQLRLDRVVASKTQMVVIDYKTGYPKKEDDHQIRQYMRFMSEMYPQKKVEGYLIYALESKIVNVL